MKQPEKQTNQSNCETCKTLKSSISWVLGVPMMIVAVSELSDIRFWYIQILALLGLVAILYWNGVFKQEEENNSYYVKNRAVRYTSRRGW